MGSRGALFAAHADRVRRTVRRRARGVGDATVDDACQIAWAMLLRRPDITLDRRGLGWLTTVAVREAWRLGAATEIEGEFSEPVDSEHRGTHDKALDRLERDERFEALHGLKPAQREALYLKGLGYTYEEIMRLTGASDHLLPPRRRARRHGPLLPRAAHRRAPGR